MDAIKVPVQKLDNGICMPEYAHAGDAGLDLRSTIDCTLQPFQRKLIPCGIALAIPEGYAGFVLPRSGLAYKSGLSIVNAPGLIDCNYRGEVQAILINLDTSIAVEIKRGDRIAQLVLMQVPAVELKECAELSDTARGGGGFGSSGIS